MSHKRPTYILAPCCCHHLFALKWLAVTAGARSLKQFSLSFQHLHSNVTCMSTLSCMSCISCNSGCSYIICLQHAIGLIVHIASRLLVSVLSLWRVLPVQQCLVDILHQGDGMGSTHGWIELTTVVCLQHS